MSELRKLFDRAVSRAQQREGVPGILGRADGQTVIYQDPDGTTHPDKCWARIGGSSGPMTELVVRCLAVPRLPGLPVIIGERNGVPTVLRTDVPLALQHTEGRLAEVAAHAWLHGRFGPDPLYLAGLAFVPLCAHPTSPPSMAVTVEAGTYRYLGEYKAWQTGDSASLAAYVPEPAANPLFYSHHFVVLCLDRANNALAVVDGTSETTTSADNPFDASDVTALTIPVAYYPLCAIHLYGGQAAIWPVDIWLDLRLWGGEHLGAGGLATSEDPESGEAPVWNGTEWVPTDVATQAELDTHEGNADAHHAKSHAHDGADGSGTVAHSALTGTTANDHHNQSHTLQGGDHPDVATTAPADGQVLRWSASASKYTPAAVPTVGGYEPLANGDAVTPELVFAGGDVIMVPIVA